MSDEPWSRCCWLEDRAWNTWLSLQPQQGVFDPSVECRPIWDVSQFLFPLVSGLHTEGGDASGNYLRKSSLHMASWSASPRGGAQRIYIPGGGLAGEPGLLVMRLYMYQWKILRKQSYKQYLFTRYILIIFFLSPSLSVLLHISSTLSYHLYLFRFLSLSHYNVGSVCTDFHFKPQVDQELRSRQDGEKMSHSLR